MSRERKILIFCCFVVVDILLIAGFLWLRNATLKNVLKNEVNALGELEFIGDRFNTKIKSKGDYAVLEKALKEYLDNYAVDLQNVLLLVYDKKLNELISIENISSNDFSFDGSIAYVENYRLIFNSSADNLLERDLIEELNNYIYEYASDDVTIDLYVKVIESNNFKENLKKSQMELEIKKIEINSHFDAILGVLNFLNLNSDKYYIQDGEIKFSNVDLYAEYVRLMGKTKRIYE